MTSYSHYMQICTVREQANVPKSKYVYNQNNCQYEYSLFSNHCALLIVQYSVCSTHSAVLTVLFSTHFTSVFRTQCSGLSVRDTVFTRCAVLDVQYSVCSTRCVVLGVQYSMCSTRCVVLGVQYSVCRTRCAVFGVQYSMSNTQCAVLITVWVLSALLQLYCWTFMNIRCMMSSFL